MNYVLEAQAQGLVDALAGFPPLREASAADAHSVVESVQASTEPGFDIDESWVTRFGRGRRRTHQDRHGPKNTPQR